MAFWRRTRSGRGSQAHAHSLQQYRYFVLKFEQLHSPSPAKQAASHGQTTGLLKNPAALARFPRCNTNPNVTTASLY